MLDFRKHSASVAARSRSDRRHIFLIVLVLGLSIILIDLARSSTIWRSLDMLLSPTQKGGGGAAIDNRLDAVPKNTAFPDTFIAANDLANSTASATPTNDGSPNVLGLSPDELASITDDRPSTRDEQPLSLKMLDILNRTDAATLAKASVGPVTYAQLLRQPGQYRGQLVSVAGTVRRANPLDIPANKYNLKKYYQLWLFPTDNPASPLVIYCLDLPKGFPTGMELAEQVELTGFFFKRLAYTTKDTVRIAPELLAKEFQWQHRPVMTPNEPAETWAIPLVVCVAVAIALLTTLVVYLRTRPTRHALPEKTPDFTALKNTEQDKP